MNERVKQMLAVGGFVVFLGSAALVSGVIVEDEPPRGSAPAVERQPMGEPMLDGLMPLGSGGATSPGRP